MKQLKNSLIAIGLVVLLLFSTTTVCAGSNAADTVSAETYSLIALQSTVTSDNILRKRVVYVEQDDYETYNVRDFGAKGDGVTDDYAAIQATINYAISKGGGEIYFPKGVYVVSATLVVDGSNISLKGVSRDLATIYSAGTGDSAGCLMLVNSGSDFFTGRLKNISIQDLGLDMSVPYQNPTYNVAWNGRAGAMVVRGSDNVVIQNIKIYKAVHEGMDVNGCYNVTIDNVYIEYLKVVTTGDGLVWGGNAISLYAFGWQTPVNVPAKIGGYRVSNCYVYGSEEWFPPLSNNANNGCNLGIMCMTGGPNLGLLQIEPVMLQNCIVERAIGGIVAEGMMNGGTGGVIVDGCTVKNCVYGVALYPDQAGDVGHASRDFILTNSYIHDIFTVGVMALGENVVISNNIINNWGMLKQSEQGLISTRLSKLAAGIYISPSYAPVTTTGVFKNVLISGNNLSLSTPHDTTYASYVVGLFIDHTNKDRIFSNIRIMNNIFDGGKSTFGEYPGGACSGIWAWGNIRDLEISHNTITGWPNSAVFFSLINDAQPAWSPSRVKIIDNMVYDLGFGTNSSVKLYAFLLRSGGQYYEVSRNTVYQVDSTNLSGLLSVPQISGANSPMSYLLVRDNVTYKLKPGGNPVELKISGRYVVEGNTDW